MMEIAERYYGSVFVVVTASLAVLAICGRQLHPSAALAMLVAGVLLLGLPHGALDPMVARKAFGDRRHTRVAFYAWYLLPVIAYWLLWSRYPTFGLCSFLAIAAVHFGSDWESRGNLVTRCAYGCAVVTLPAWRFHQQVAALYAMLGTRDGALLATISATVAPLALGIAFLGAALRFRHHSRDAIELLTIAIGALLLAPLVFFTCYFALLHSPRHLLETANRLGITSVKRVCRETLPIVLATLALAGLAYPLLPHIGWDARMLRVVFSGLAALTVPHMLLDTIAARKDKDESGDSPLP